MLGYTPAYFRVSGYPPTLETREAEMATYIDQGGAVYNVRGYGALGNGTADDSAALAGSTSAQHSGDAVVVPAGTYRIASDVTLSKAFRFERGAVLAPDSGKTVTITGQVEAGQWQIFGGAGNVVFGAGYRTPEVWVDWFGAASDKSADVTAAVNRAIASLPDTAAIEPAVISAASTLVFGRGEYLVTSSAVPSVFTPFGEGKSVLIRGMGVESTRIYFDPPAPADSANPPVLFTLIPGTGGNLVQGYSMRDFSILGENTSTKVGVKVVEARNFTMENLIVSFNVPGDHHSIGLYLYGRDISSVRNVVVAAGRAIVVGVNPFTGEQKGLDHWCFTDVNLENVVSATTPQHPLVEVPAGVDLSQVEFTGRQTWVGGKGGFHFDNPTAGLDIGNVHNLVFENVRWEPGGPEADYVQGNPVFHIRPSKLGEGVSFRNVYCGITAVDDTGVYLRRCRQVTFQDVQFIGKYDAALVPPRGSKAYDLDTSCDDVLLLNCQTNQGVLPSVTGMAKVFSSGHHNVGPVETEQIRFLQSSDPDRWPDLYFSVLDQNIYTRVVRIADQGYVAIPAPASFSMLAIAQVLVAFDKVDAGDAAGGGGGHFVVSGDGTQPTVKLSGTADITTASTAGSAAVFKEPGSDRWVVQNRLGGYKTFSITVFYAHKTPIQ
jgi:hypothetical protein